MAGTRLKTTFAALSIALLLVACNENDQDAQVNVTSTNNSNSINNNLLSLTVTPSLGKILNAKVILRNARTGAELGRSNTGLIG